MKLATVKNASLCDIKAAINALDTNKRLKVNGLYAADIEALKNSSPALFARVADFIKSGRWYPFVGTYSNNTELSPAALIKSCLYSVQYFKTNFGKEYRVFHGTKIYNGWLPQIIYSSLFDAALIDSETQTRWLCGTDGHRTLSVYSETVPADDCTDGEFMTCEEYAQQLFSTEMNLETLTLPSEYTMPDDIERELLNAECYSVISENEQTADIRKAWIKYLTGDKNGAAADAVRISNNKTADISSVFRVSESSVTISELKYAEDGSGDTVLRVRETSGKEKSAYIMCDRLSAGFRFEIMPYEIQTFRIKGDGSGSVTEIYICE